MKLYPHYEWTPEGFLHSIHLKNTPQLKRENKLHTSLLKWEQAWLENKEADISFEEVQEILDPKLLTPARSSYNKALLENTPWGKAMSYGDIAQIMQPQSSPRGVGTLCRTNPWPGLIPCHRVSAAKGSIGGYQLGVEIKESLWKREGING